MSKHETILQILKKIKPIVNFEEVNGILDNGYLDSMEFMSLISELEQSFNVEISADEITAENFDTIETIVEMIERIEG